jgi:hypothetical protein
MPCLNLKDELLVQIMMLVLIMMLGQIILIVHIKKMSCLSILACPDYVAGSEKMNCSINVCLYLINQCS